MSEEELFAAALETPVSERSGFLDKNCGNDLELRARVERLLKAHDNPDSIFDSPAQTQASTSIADTNLAKRLGDFEIIRQIGQGGMGIVFEARQVSLNRRVALKVLASGLGLTAKAVMRFRREAEAAAKLHHTNIVPVYATGEDCGVHFYAMELIEGPSLDRVIQRLQKGAAASIEETSDDEPIPRWVDDTIAYQRPSVASSGCGPAAPGAGSSSSTRNSEYFDAIAKMIADVADALEHAHDQGVIHRDVKPSNLLLGPDGRLSVNDFGLARMLEQPGMTMTGEFVGSPLYMSPEQITAGRAPLDHRTDIYSLGASLYELLTLQPPFPGASRDHVIGQILHKDPRPPRRANRHIPADLETVCLKAIERDPDRRYQTAGRFAADLRSFVGRHAIQARRIGPIGKVVRWSRRHKALSTALVCVAVFAVIAGYMAWRAYDVEATLRRDRAMDEAIAAALNGELTTAQQRIKDAELHNASVAWVEMLRGEVAIFGGKNSEGIEHLRQAVAIEPDNVAARSMLAYAYLMAGRWDFYLDTTMKLDDANPFTAEDHIFLARARFPIDPRNSVELLDRALQIRRSPIAFMNRAMALAYYALDSGDLQKAERSLEDAEVAQRMLPSSGPTADLVQLYARLAAVSLYRQAGKEAEASQLLDRASENVRILSGYEDFIRARYLISHYHRFRGDYKAAIAVHTAPRVPVDIGFVSVVLAASAFEAGAVDEALQTLNAIPTPRSVAVEWNRTILLLDSSGDKQQARDLLKDLTQQHYFNRHPLAPHIFWLIGDREEMRRQAAAVLEAGYFTARWSFARELLKFQIGEIDRNELLRQAAGSARDLGLAHYYVGLEQLSRGQRAEARRSFRESADTGVFYWGEINWSQAFLARMNQDPEWPRWLP